MIYKRFVMNTAKAKLGASFGWLNATQFLGVFNDNIFKLLVILLLIELQSDSRASSVSILAKTPDLFHCWKYR